MIAGRLLRLRNRLEPATVEPRLQPSQRSGAATHAAVKALTDAGADEALAVAVVEVAREAICIGPGGCRPDCRSNSSRSRTASTEGAPPGPQPSPPAAAGLAALALPHVRPLWRRAVDSDILTPAGWARIAARVASRAASAAPVFAPRPVVPSRCPWGRGGRGLTVGYRRDSVAGSSWMAREAFPHGAGSMRLAALQRALRPIRPIRLTSPMPRRSARLPVHRPVATISVLPSGRLAWAGAAQA